MGRVARALSKAAEFAQGAVDYADVRRARARDLVPASMPLLYVEVLTACNLRCSMCGYPTDYPNRGELLTTEEIEGMFREAVTLRTKVVSFAGGEPFLRKDMVRLIRTAGQLGLPVHINTNGTRLTDALVEQLADFDHLSLVLSLDHWDPQINDRIRGAGVFEQVRQAAERLRRLAPRVSVGMNTVLGGHVLGTTQRQLELAASWGITCAKFLPIHVNLGHGWKTDGVPELLHLPLDRLPELADELATLPDRARALGLTTSSRAYLQRIPDYLRGDLQFPCYAGYVYGNVDPYGYVFPCYDHMEDVNIRDVGLAGAWASPAMQRMRQQVKSCSTPCWCGGNAEPSIRMEPTQLLADPKQLIADLEFYAR